jgi:branched-chain amino acid transport system substrate-binding protein
MQKYMRWSGILIALIFVLAACQNGNGGDGTASPDETASPDATNGTDNGNGTGDDPEAVCDEDEFGCYVVGPGEPIVIGTALVITGPDASLGLDSQYGVEVAGRMVNDDGGVMGHEVEFDHQDDGCNAEGGQAAARALTTAEVAAIIGTSCSSAGVPAAEIASDAGILIVSPSNTAPSLTAEGTHQPFYARTAHNDEVQGLAMAQFVCNELGHTTAATIHDGSPYAEQLQAVFVDAFADECDGETVGTEQVDPQARDFSSVLESLGTGSPEFLYYPIFTAAGALVTQQAREVSALQGTDLAAADGVFSPDFLAAAGDAAEGMYLSGPDLEYGGSFYADEFVPAYTDVSGESEPISVFHAHAYDAANLIFAAIEAVAMEGDDGTLYIPRTALRDAVLNGEVSFDGITGSLTCESNGDCADPAISVSEVQGGDFVRIWP